MRSLLVFTFIIAAIVLVHVQQTYAGCLPPVGDVINCTDAPPNPDTLGVQQNGSVANLTVNVQEGLEINTLSQMGLPDGVNTGLGNDQINTNNATVRGKDRGIESSNGEDVLNIILSIISGLERGIDTGNGADTVNVNGSQIESDNDIALMTANADDIVTVENSQVTSAADDGIETANGDDMVSITNSIITAGPGSFAVDLGNNDDMLTLNNGADLRGGIDCRNDFDTLIFAMQVPTSQLAEITADIESKNPAGDSIVINGLFYEWQECEELVAQLQPGFVSPVPTLSEWGLIAMAGILGIVGFMLIHRRKVAV